MKRLYIIVEGQTEQEFVNSMIAPYLSQNGIYNVVPLLIKTSKSGRGGFVNYNHLRNDVKRLLYSSNDDFVVTMLVDYFRIPDVPHKEKWGQKKIHVEQVYEMEKCIGEDIQDHRFIPYIQMHEFEALLFASNKGFSTYFEENLAMQTAAIVNAYENPEDINTTPEGAPSKRILSIKPNYQKVIEGNLIALEIGMEQMLSKCPRFKEWIETIINLCRKT